MAHVVSLLCVMSLALSCVVLRASTSGLFEMTI